MFILIVIAVAALFTAGALFLTRRVKARKKAPTSWIISGDAPAYQAEALAIIAKHTPGMTQAGLITWVDGPFDLAPGKKAAGVIWSYNPINIQLTYFDKIEETALVHELGHAWNGLTNQGFGESPTDLRFVKWINDINAEIKAAAGR
jgi:hypothetical protein